MQTTQRIAGALFGMAFGDSLAAETEFLSVDAILRTFPPHGPTDLTGNPALVTDDTQMALAVGEALLLAEQPYTAITLEQPLRKAFITWNESPENDRAPGVTCMRACENLARGLPWYDATVPGSKGCGANMRIAPVGLLPEGRAGVTSLTRAAIAQFQAALTHGHPTGLAAADLTAFAMAQLMTDCELATLPSELCAYALSQREVYHHEWLGSLWQRSHFSSAESYIAHGWDECLHVLTRLETALHHPDRDSDPCLSTGAGWIAEEAFATGLLCFLLFPEDPKAAINRAAVTSGDSDSIACLTGAFAGAYNGDGGWPAGWTERIEYKDRLKKLVDFLGGR